MDVGSYKSFSENELFNRRVVPDNNDSVQNDPNGTKDFRQHLYSKSMSEQKVEIELGSLDQASNNSSRRVSVTPAGDAIVIRNAQKSYTSGQPILKGLNMTVPCGSIYGLLGSSGCGKTTILSCIVGIRKLDKGQIRIFGEPPGTRSVGVPGRNVGYMPQDISLYLEFSIAETLNYFGTLSGMSKEEIIKAKKFFLAFLDLPEESRRVGTLSGGQQRRVSLVAALLSGPELLILDEPTVGVDPLIRQNIWHHLKKLVNSKRTTVIITTHYIEECRSADNIGIMRNGVLLEERPPQVLMIEHNSNNLEKIVLSLSRIDNQAQQSRPKSKKKSSSGSIESELVSNVPFAKVLYEASPGIKDSLVRIRALTGKNFVILLRNPLLLFFVLLIAAFMVVLMCVALGQDPKNLTFGLVNLDVNYHSNCPNVTSVEGECFVDLISCRYLERLKPSVLNLEVYENEEEAINSVRTAATWGYFLFPENFSQSFYERVFVGGLEDELTFNSSKIVLKLDESNKQVSNSIKVTVVDAFKDFMFTILSNCGFDARQGESSLRYNRPIFGKDTTDFRDFLAPAAALVVIFFFPIITTSIRYIKEKKSGVLHRSIVTGVATWEIMAAYSISEFCVLFLQTIINYAILYHAFGIELSGSSILLMILFLLSGYGGVAMGFLIGSVCSEEIQAAILSMAAFFPNMLLSGIIWPKEGIAVPLQYIVPALPCTLAGEAARSIGNRGWGFTHPNVWPGFAILTAYIFGYFILTILFHVFVHK